MLGRQAANDCLIGSGMVPSRFGDKSIYASGNCHRPTAEIFLAILGRGPRAFQIGKLAW